MLEYHCSAEVAQRYGLDIAVFLHGMVFWVTKNRANDKHYHDGRWWTYNSTKALCQLYPLWSERQLNRIIKQCEELGLLHTGNYNEDRRDRTRWYSPSDEIMEAYGIYTEADTEDAETVDRNLPDGKMQVTKASDTFDQTVGPLPVILPVDIPPISPAKKEGKRPREVASAQIADRLARYANGSQPLERALLDFLDHRRAGRKPIATTRAFSLLLNRLDEYSGGDEVAKIGMLNEAMLKGWSTVYLPKDGRAPQAVGAGRVVDDEGLQVW